MRITELTQKDLPEIYKEFCEELPGEAIQRTKGRETGKGYNTDGYGYQWIADRLNAVVGLGHWQCETREAYTERSQTSKGRAQFEVGFDVQVSLGNWVAGDFEPLAKTPWTPGNHLSISLGDARKGAMTNGFKKAIAFFGLGADAYRGELDQDNRPLPDYERPENSSRPPLTAVPDELDYSGPEYYDKRDEREEGPPATNAQIGRLKGDLKRYLTAAGKSNIDVKDERFVAAVTGRAGRPVGNYDDLTKSEASNLIDCLEGIVAELFTAEVQQQTGTGRTKSGNRRRAF